MNNHFYKKTNGSNSWYPPAEAKIPFSALISALLPLAADFEGELSRYLGVDHCICANSGRSLLTLVLQTLRKRYGKQRDEVLIPGYTCYSVAAAVVRAGLKIRVYDLNPKTFHPDLDSAKCGTNERTLAIVAQHLFGIPSPVDGLKGLAKDMGAYLIEDAAQALGGSLNGFNVGTLGDFGFYSFGRGKPLPLGHGGALVGSDPDIMRDIALTENGMGYRHLFITAVVQMLAHRNLYGIMEALPLGLGETIFDPGFMIFPMPVVMRRLGMKTLGTLKLLNAHRCTIAGIYSDLLQGHGTVSVQECAQNVYVRYPVMVSSGTITRNLLQQGVRRMYPKALIDEPSINQFIVERTAKTPGASMIAQCLITLPTHSGIKEDLAAKIASDLKAPIGLLF